MRHWSRAQVLPKGHLPVAHPSFAGDNKRGRIRAARGAILNTTIDETLRAERFVQLTPLVGRLIAPNGGPFTYTGTCTYLIGAQSLIVLDPGPESEVHYDGLVAAIAGRPVSHIVVTHTHRDHSPLARRLKAATGAPIWGCAPHFPARPLFEGEVNLLDASADQLHAPDRVLEEGDLVDGDGATLTAIATPGHTMNHLAFAFAQENTLFSGDHVMAWSTSIVAPPDGDMAAYMASLDKLKSREESVFWPGHGGPVEQPQRFVRGLLTHRRQRETAILARLAEGDRLISQIVPKIYDGLAPRLHAAAALSVFAHLEDLAARGLVISDSHPTLTSEYRPG
ncbi:MAG: MBL fold metallo-hydrolase [Beijerinckiaceae bacterium]|nr:MBL fold metallo-hydrolase [Beijerinckiaceae bacterium]